MKPLIFYFLLIFLVIGCTENQESPKARLSKSEKEKILEFSQKLQSSINEYDYTLIRNAWSNPLFVKEVGNLTSTQKTVFDYFWKEEWANLILNNNIDIINLLKYNNGTIKISKLEDLNSHYFINFSLLFNSFYVDFIRYKVEIENDEPKLSDFYSFKTDKWMSQRLRELMNLATMYPSSSTERRTAYAAMNASQQQMKTGDTLEALNQLNRVHKSFANVYEVSFQRMQIAEYLPDSVYYNVLLNEFQNNKSRYIKYRYTCAFGDKDEILGIMQKLADDTGEIDFIDSLLYQRYYWY